MGQGNSKAEHKGNGDNQEKNQIEEELPRTSRSQKRISFYETVDASEVLPFLIIGELIQCLLLLQ